MKRPVSWPEGYRGAWADVMAMIALRWGAILVVLVWRVWCSFDESMEVTGYAPSHDVPPVGTYYLPVSGLESAPLYNREESTYLYSVHMARLESSAR